MRVVREIVGDAVAIARWFNQGRFGMRELLTTLSHDGSQALALQRLRQALRRSHVPVAGAVVRRVQTALFGIEISSNVELGEGVIFLHTVGVVIGGDARVGDRVTFLGNNTLGTLDWRGYPRIGNDVVIGAGARIIGPVTVGDGAAIGANAVVVSDVPAGATAVGVPAVIKRRSTPPRNDVAPEPPTGAPESATSAARR
jgi:serine acetyltransferase